MLRTLAHAHRRRPHSIASAAATVLLCGHFRACSAAHMNAMEPHAAWLLVRDSIIPAFGDNRKGSHGRVVIIGGSFEYSGAPYYAGISALKTGADLAIVLCARSAGSAIKAYSPELIVHAILPSKSDLGVDAHAVDEAINAQLQRADSVVIGPGLGRDEITLAAVTRAIAFTARAGLPTVLDGDALFLLSQQPQLVAEHPAVVLTPNGAEFLRLWEATRVPGRPASSSSVEKVRAQYYGTSGRSLDATVLSHKLGGAVVVQKGPIDVIAAAAAAAVSAALGAASVDSGDSDAASSQSVPAAVAAVWVAGVGSPRRCGGQGDVLAGALGAFLAWAKRSALFDAVAAEHSVAALAATTGVQLSLQHPPASGPLHVTATISSMISGSSNTSSGSNNTSSGSSNTSSGRRLDVTEALVACAGAAALVTRHAASLAFAKSERATTTPDIIALLGAGFTAAFGPPKV